MKLEYAFLATTADRLHDGRVCAWGIGFDKVQADGTPILFQWALVAKLLLFPDEDLEGHSLRLELVRPNGEREPMSDDTRINTIRNTVYPSEPSNSNIVIQLVGAIRDAGRHVLHLIVDGEELKSLPFTIELTLESNQNEST